MWQRLQPSLSNERVRAERGWSPGALWKIGGWGTLAASLLVAAFLAGRGWDNGSDAGSGRGSDAGSNGGSNGGSVAGASDEQIRERVLLGDLGGHLDRTEQALVEFVSQSGERDDTDAQARSEDLVAANRLYRDTAAATGDRAVTEVLDDLERVLIEVAGAPANAPPAEIEAIRRRIDARDLLFKLRVMRMELEQRASDPRPAKRQGPTT